MSVGDNLVPRVFAMNAAWVSGKKCTNDPGTYVEFSVSICATF